MSQLSVSQVYPSSSWPTLPTEPGVYIYKDTQNKIIYIGKAKNIKSRVKSYFAPIQKLLPKTQKLVSNIHTISIIPVQSEIEALLLESKLIKTYKPFYNIASKDDKSPYYIHITKEEFPKPLVNHNPTNSIAGPFLSGFQARQILKKFRRIAPFCTAQRSAKRPCFYSHLNLCSPCPGSENPDKTAYQKNIQKLKSLLKGNFKHLRSQLLKQMQDLSRKKAFENAAKIRDQLNHLDILLSIPISPDTYIENPNLTSDLGAQSMEALRKHLKLDKLNRIELFDNAHLSGSSPTSAMTVAINGIPNTSLYRHFHLKSIKKADDVQYMKEVIERRLKRLDWPTPDLIILDGGMPQLSILKSINTQIPFVSLAKQNEEIYFPNGQKLTLSRSDPALNLLINLRNEAHRFSRSLHHKRQTKQMFSQK